MEVKIRFCGSRGLPKSTPRAAREISRNYAPDRAAAILKAFAHAVPYLDTISLRISTPAAVVSLQRYTPLDNLLPSRLRMCSEPDST